MNTRFQNSTNRSQRSQLGWQPGCSSGFIPAAIHAAVSDGGDSGAHPSASPKS